MRYSKKGGLFLSTKRKKNKGENFRAKKKLFSRIKKEKVSDDQIGNNTQKKKEEENTTVTNIELDIKIEPSDDYEEPSLPVIGEVFSKKDMEINAKSRDDTAKETSNILQGTSFASHKVSRNITLQDSVIANDESQNKDLDILHVYCEENEKLLKSVIHFLNNCIKEDKFDLIGKLCAFRLKSLRTNQCDYAKILISEVIDNAELGYINYKYVLPKTFPSRGQTSKFNSSGQEMSLNEVSSDPLFKSYKTYANIPKSNSEMKHKKKFCSEKVPLLDKIKKLLEHHSEKDQFDELGEYYANKLRAVSNRECVNAEKLIADILFYAELGCLYPDVLSLHKLTDYSKKFCCHDNFLPKTKNVYTQTLSSESSLRDKSGVLSFQTLIKSADLLMEKPGDKFLLSTSNANLEPSVLSFPHINSNSTLIQTNSHSVCQTEISNLNSTAVFGNTSCILPPSCSSDTVLSGKFEHPFQSLINSANLLMEKPTASTSSSLNTKLGSSSLTQSFLKATTSSCSKAQTETSNSTSLANTSSSFLLPSHSSTTQPSFMKPVQAVVKSTLTRKKLPTLKEMARKKLKIQNKEAKIKTKDIVSPIFQHTLNLSMVQTNFDPSFTTIKGSDSTQIPVDTSLKFPSQSFAVTESTSNYKLASKKLVEMADFHKKKSPESIKDYNKSSEMITNTEAKDISDSSFKQTISLCPTISTGFSRLTSIDTGITCKNSFSQSSFASAPFSDKSENLNFSTLVKKTDSIMKRSPKKNSYKKCYSKFLPLKPSTKNINQNILKPCLMDTSSSCSDPNVASSLMSLSLLANEPYAFEAPKSTPSETSEKHSETLIKPVDQSTVNKPTRKSSRICARNSFLNVTRTKETVSPISKNSLDLSLMEENSLNSALSKRTSSLTSTTQKIAPKLLIPSSASTSSCSFSPTMISTNISNLTSTPNTFLSNSSSSSTTTTEENTDPKQSVVPFTQSVSVPSIQASAPCSFSPTVISNITPTFAPFNSFVTLPVNSQPSVYMIPMNQPSNYPSTMNTGAVQFSLNILPPR